MAWPRLPGTPGAPWCCDRLRQPRHCDKQPLNLTVISAYPSLNANVEHAQGTTILQYVDAEHGMWANLGFEALFVAAFFLLAFLGLTFVKHSKR